MIDFSCHCGHAISVGEELAGGLVQCPKCRRLNDVPRLGDLKDLESNGIYKIDAPPPGPGDEHRVSELTTAFTREHFDASGEPIDLRDSFADPRTGPIPLEALGPLESAAPKYDPITGELVQSIEIKPDTAPDPATLPIATRAVAPPPRAVDGIEVPTSFEAMSIPLRLFKPMNLLVMFFILLAHLLGQGLMVAIGALYLLLVPFWMALHGLIIGHYANVIDETGPSNKNELPAPMRHLDWHEDTFGSFVRATIALTVCYGPSLLLLNYQVNPAMQQLVLIASACLALIGTAFFPAAILTTTTSGSVLNLRPDRMVAVAMVCGAEYVVAVITWTIGAALALWGTFATSFLSLSVLGSGPVAASITVPMALTPNSWLPAETSIAVGIYLLHAFAWHIGILYRRHHQRFPWLYQRHDRARSGVAQAQGFPVRRAPRPRPASAPTKPAPRVQSITPPQKSR